MKKLTSLLVAIAMVAAMFAIASPATAAEGCESCTACGDGDAFPLYAGQDVLVGDVLVKNCEGKLSVQYVLNAEAIAAGWKITEVHLAIGDALSDIPQTKKGNPIPGQFEVNEPLSSGVTSTQVYCFEGDWIAGDDILVAAHAVITRRAPGQWTTVWQIGDVEDRDPVTGLLYNYADEFNWEYPAGPTTMGPTLAQSRPLFTNPFIIGASETAEFPFNSNYNLNYARSVDVQWDGALPWGGRLTVSWSPGNSAAETKIIELVGDGVGAPETFSAVGTNATGAGWFMNMYKLVENEVSIAPLAYGTHTLNFLHTRGDGTFWDWIRLEQPGLESDTAWGAGTDFPGANWATYSTYTFQECVPPEPVLVDTVRVYPLGTNPYLGNPYPSNITLESGKTYRLEASGTYRFANWGADYGIADAAWNARTAAYSPTGIAGWFQQVSTRLQVWIGGAAVAWQPAEFNPEHIYTLEMAGTGSPVVFTISDDQYNDNSGFITVKIYELP